MTKHDDIQSLLGQIHHQDCISGMRRIADGQIDLVFADPPFNIGYEYDVYDDRLESEKYLDWSRQWMSEVHRVLKANGAFWLAIGDEYAAELKVAANEIRFHCRSWVIWYYTFGVHCTHKFTRSHAHLFHFVKDPENFTFNNQDPRVRVPSARQLVYADARANPKGRMPDDTWILRPQDLVDGFTTSEDVWYFPRVAGTFKERAGFHGCQMPEQLLGRIIRSCSNEGDIVLDPFSGSATTVSVAKKLGRHFLSFEISDEYAALGRKRLQAIAEGDPLDGAEDPRFSAPSTAAGKQRKSAPRPQGFRQGKLDFVGLEEDDEQIIEAFKETNEGFSVDRVVIDPVLCDDFQNTCDRKGVSGTAAERNRELFRLRKSGKLKEMGVETQKRTVFLWQEQSPYIFASEIAWRQLSDLYPDKTLDELLCDPRIAEQFDSIASRFAPGFLPLEYRWAALTIRKQARSAKTQARKHTQQGLKVDRFDSAVPLDKLLSDLDAIPATPGVYAIHDGDQRCLYASESHNLRNRLRAHFADEAIEHWHTQSDQLEVSHQPHDTVSDFPMARHCYLIKWYKPAWNIVEAFSL